MIANAFAATAPVGAAAARLVPASGVVLRSPAAAAGAVVVARASLSLGSGSSGSSHGSAHHVAPALIGRTRLFSTSTASTTSAGVYRGLSRSSTGSNTIGPIRMTTRQRQQRRPWTRGGVSMMMSSSSSGSTSGGSSSSTPHSPVASARRKEEEEAGAAKCCSPSHSHSHGHGPAVPTKEGWVSRAFLQKFTVAASILCAIDCTVFPALIAILQAYEFVGPETHEALGGINLHELSHQAALYVVLPIGTTTTLSNYILHRDKPLAALSCAGLALIFGANATGVEWLPSALHESRLWNTLGCGMLIGSSYLAHRSEAGHDHSPHGHGRDGHGHKHAEEGKGAKAK